MGVDGLKLVQAKYFGRVLKSVIIRGHSGPPGDDLHWPAAKNYEIQVPPPNLLISGVLYNKASEAIDNQIPPIATASVASERF